MVKIQKPNPKSVKKCAPEKAKNVQMKKSKEKTKDVMKAIKITSEKEVIKSIKPKSVVSNKKGLGKIKESIAKKKEVNAQPTEIRKETALKKKEKSNVVEVKDSPTKSAEKKKSIVEKNKNDLEKEDQSDSSKIKIQKKNIKEAPVFEPVDFNEDNFKDIVNLERTIKIIEALKTLVEKEGPKKKGSIFSDYKYFLDVSSYKIPTCPKRIVKLNLQHSLVDIKADDVVLIVPDLQRGAKVDYEPTIQHYEDILRELELDTIKVVPFNKLRNECTSFEAKRKFANTYDFFLCDGRIVGHVVGFCGKHFQKPRTTIHAVGLNNPKTYKKEIEHALKRTAYRQIKRGDMISIPFGNHLFSLHQLGENVVQIIKQLKTIFPGGYANIRRMTIKIDIKGTSSLPLFVNLCAPPAEVPNVIGPREQKMVNLKKKANDILSKFAMSKSGDFIKLTKAEAKKKRNINEARTALLSKEDVNSDDNESDPPLKKAKKNKQITSEGDENKDVTDNTNEEDSEEN